MFPLGSVLFPRAVLPLHVFEPRYRALVELCLAGDQEFGVVLIERGSEVGGGDARFDVGTLARIVETSRFDDGRYAVIALGTARMRVREWLPDDPFPRAIVEVLDELDAQLTDRDVLDTVTRQLRRVLALGSELGMAAPPGEVRLDDDPVRAGFEACALAPIGPLDAQRLLEIDDPTDRLARIEELLTDTAELLELRLAEG
jgi:uncharacterized protein